MKIFLSYAGEDREQAASLNQMLEAEGYEVFFDRTDLRPGEKYNQKIHDEAASSDLMIFLISPDSVAEGSYTLTELKWAKEKWPDPEGHILPVMIRRTEYKNIPAFIKSVLTVLEPEGNLEAELLHEVNIIAKRRFTDNTRMSWTRGFRKGRAFGEKLTARFFDWLK